MTRPSGHSVELGHCLITSSISASQSPRRWLPTNGAIFQLMNKARPLKKRGIQDQDRKVRADGGADMAIAPRSTHRPRRLTTNLAAVSQKDGQTG